MSDLNVEQLVDSLKPYIYCCACAVNARKARIKTKVDLTEENVAKQMKAEILFESAVDAVEVLFTEKGMEHANTETLKSFKPEVSIPHKATHFGDTESTHPEAGNAKSINPAG